MRATNPLLFGLGALALGSLLIAACSDSLHLDPEPRPGAGGTGPGGGGPGGGGNAPIPCASNSDCPAPTAVCNTVRRECVECLELDDCGFRPGTVCSEGTCACPVSGQEFCEALGPSTAARCVDKMTSSTDCGACGRACFGACALGDCADPWEPTSLVNAPAPRLQHVAVWTGSSMVVWGGELDGGVTNTGGIYDPATWTWKPTSAANAPAARRQATAVWTGSEMIVWGGFAGAPLGDGAAFDPATNTWTALPKEGAPSPRRLHAAVWTGSEMIIWGGFDETNNLGDGAAYDPATQQWTPLPASPLSVRRQHSAVWTGSSMIVWGGYGYDAAAGGDTYLRDGAAYDPSLAGSWTAIAVDGNTPDGRIDHTAVWNDTEMSMMIWGGYNGSALSSGSEYDPVANSWLGTSNQPLARRLHTGAYIGGAVDRMIMWGGEGTSGYLGSGNVYDAMTNTWVDELPTAPTARGYHTVVVADTRMIIWGGVTPGGRTNTGAVLFASKL